MRKLVLICFWGLCLAGCSDNTTPSPVSVEEEEPVTAQSLKEQQQELDMLARPYEIDLRMQE